MSERLTENIVRRNLEKNAKKLGASVWEQKPANARISALLKGASKQGRGAGYPDFIVGFDEHSDFLLAIECKADVAAHADNGGGPAVSAVGGAKHYAKFLSAGYNVLAIAVSGTKSATLSVSHFWHLQGEDSPQDTDIPSDLHSLDRYLEFYAAKLVAGRNEGVVSLDKLAKRLNTKMHDLKLTPAKRALLVSAILVCLKDDLAFRNSYRNLNGIRLLKSIKDTFYEKMSAAGVDEKSMEGIRGSYGFMNPEGTGDLTKERHLVDMVSNIDEDGTPAIRRLGYYDAIGRFYLEFLRYSNNDATLGIVLTPPHITDLAADLTEIGADDVVYDNCAGTGGFLISAMRKMLSAAKGNTRKEEQIKKTQILGTEQQADIVALLHSNMFLHGDGRSSVRKGDCFHVKPPSKATGQKVPTVGLLNPPFKDKNMSGIEELEFILNNLNALKKGGYSRCAAILPMPWTRGSSRGVQFELKRQLLEKHTLEAVISLPDALFYNSKASVVTCLMIFKAHQPHADNKKTWFAYGKDDGFEMRRHRGRIDYTGRWAKVRNEWVSWFLNKDVIPNFSVMRHVGPQDEWCAEEYLETDYAAPSVGDYQRVLRDFALAKCQADWPISGSDRAVPKKHKLCRLNEVFKFERGHGLPLNGQEECADGINFVNRGSTNNGVKTRIAPLDGVEPKPAGMLTVAAGGSVGETFLQTEPFYTGVGNICLSPRGKMSDGAKLYYCMIIRANKFRYNYGREPRDTLGSILVPSPDSLPGWVDDIDWKAPMRELVE